MGATASSAGVGQAASLAESLVPGQGLGFRELLQVLIRGSGLWIEGLGRIVPRWNLTLGI